MGFRMESTNDFTGILKVKHFCLQSRARICFTSSYLVKINKATKNPSECVHDVSLLHKGLTIIQTGSYSVRILVRPDRISLLFKAKECIYIENMLGKRAPVSVFYLKLFSFSENSNWK